MANNAPNEELEREIFNAIGEGSFADMLDVEAQSTHSGRSGRSGVVAAIHGRNVLVEFGPIPYFANLAESRTKYSRHQNA